MMYITLYYHDVAVVMIVRFFLVSPVRLSCLHRSSGEPRSTSIEPWLIVPAQHASSSTDSAGHVDTPRLLMCDTATPRVLTAPLRLDSNLLATLEGALMVPLTCLTCGFPVYPPLASPPSQQKGCSTPWEPPPQHPSTAAPQIHVMINGVMEW